LRSALERGAAAQHELQLLLQEQRHRTKNDLALLSSMIALQARSQSSPLVRAALESAGARLRRRRIGSRSTPTCDRRSDGRYAGIS
jgi:two-component sensor histidine kinase